MFRRCRILSIFLLLLVSLCLLFSGCSESKTTPPAPVPPQAKPTVLQPNVEVVSQQQATTQIATVTDTTVVMQQDAPTYKTGDIIISDSGEGLLRQVTGVAANPDGTSTLQTQQAALTDVFQSVEVHQQFIIKPEDVRSFTPRTRGVTLRSRIPVNRADVSLFTTEMQLNVPITDDGALALKGSVGIGLKMEFDLVIDNGKLQAFQLAIVADASAKLALNATGKLNVSLSHFEKELAAIQFAEITIWVPTPIGIPAPIQFNFNMVPYFFDDSTFITTGTIKLIGLDTSVKCKAGVRINSDRSASPIKEASYSKPELSGLLYDLAKCDPNNSASMQPLIDMIRNTNLEFKVKNRFRVGARFECKLYGVVGPYVKLELLEFESSTALNVNTTTPSIVFDNLVRCQPLQSAGVRLDIFNKNIIDVSVDASNSPIAFEQHLPLPLLTIFSFPITIPLTGKIEATVN